MTEEKNRHPAPDRKPRLLWANAFCLLDTASGASMAVRQMLIQLVKNGWEVQILGATVFDHPRGTAGLQGQWPAVKKQTGRFVKVADGLLEHLLLVTENTSRNRMMAAEEGAWFGVFSRVLAGFRPDVVFYYGGRVLDFLVSSEARYLGIPVVFYLANGNYTRTRWCRDVDLVLTDSLATADLYVKRLGIHPVPVGAFIDPEQVTALHHRRERILFVNPTYEKGAALVARLAMLLERRRPDMVFEVVEARGRWADVLKEVTTAFGEPRQTLANVVVTPNTPDMRPVYGRARVVLAPSMWWESAGRVTAEAMLNGIPAVVTGHGGMPEMVGDGGLVLRLDPVYHEKPFTRIPPDAVLMPLIHQLEALFDDPDRYAALCERARLVGRSLHGLEASTRRLLNALLGVGT
jgi:glycosyltransferase involved in cell wall biosynthesis